MTGELTVEQQFMVVLILGVWVWVWFCIRSDRWRK